MATCDVHWCILKKIDSPSNLDKITALKHKILDDPMETAFLITISVLFLKQYCCSSLVSLEMYYFAYDTFPKVLRTYNCHKRIIVMWVSTSILNFFAASRMKKKEGLQSNRLLSGNKWKWALDIVRYVGYQIQDNTNIN